MPRLSFTAKTLERLAPPPRGAAGEVVQVDYWDESMPGFGLRLSSSGARTWVVLKRVLRNGNRRLARFQVGRYVAKADDPSGLTLAVARAKAQALIDMTRQDEDPKVAKQLARQKKVTSSRNTFGAVADLYLKPGATKRDRRAATLEQYERILKGKACAPWLDLPIASITRADIIGLVDGIKEAGKPVAANRTLAAIRAMLNWAANRGHLGSSPAHDIEAPAAETPRERHLYGDAEKNLPSEIGLAWAAFGRCGWPAPFLRTLMLSGQRRDEVAGMRWDELIDLKGAAPRWFLPGERTKNGRDHVVPLGPALAKMLRALPRVGESPFVFTTTGESPISGFGKIKLRAGEEIANLKAEDPARYTGQFDADWVLHDLRRTFDTGLRELGVSGEVVDALTNHVSGDAKKGARKHYNHARYDEAKRAAMMLWEHHVTSVKAPL